MFGMDKKLEKPRETTSTILAKLQAKTGLYVLVEIEEKTYRIPLDALKLFMWNNIPDVIKDETSEEARNNQTFRIALKALIRPFLPKIITKTWGEGVEIEQGINVLQWLPVYLIHVLSAIIATKKWKIDVTVCEDCTQSVYEVRSITPIGFYPETAPTTATESVRD